MLYQPRIKDELIRKLYFFAKRERKPMTKVLNQIVEKALIDEPTPPPYEKRYLRLALNVAPSVPPNTNGNK